MKAPFCFVIACLIFFQKRKGGMTGLYRQNVMVGLFVCIQQKSFQVCKRRRSSQRSLILYALIYITDQSQLVFMQLISRYGVRLNIRETERKRRRKTGNEPFPATQGEKRKHSSRDGDDDDDDSVWT